MVLENKNVSPRVPILLEKMTNIHLVKISTTHGQKCEERKRKRAHILNNATTSSVVVKLSISG